MLKFFFYVSCFFVFATSIAQENTSNDYHLITSLHTGTVGFGLDFKYVQGRHTARLGYSAIPFHYSTTFDMGMSMLTDIQVTYSNLHAIYEFQPVTKWSWLKIAGGFAYFSSAKGVATLNPRDAVTTSIVTLTPDEIGSLTIAVDSKGVAPYLGLGLGKSSPKKRFNVNFDLGTYLLSAPNVTVIGTKLLSDNQSLGTTLTEEMKTYRWLPLLQINFNYLIK
jgi:hypothetical protein